VLPAVRVVATRVSTTRATSPEPELGAERDGGQQSGWSWTGRRRRRLTINRSAERQRRAAGRPRFLRAVNYEVAP
jgi:hypothetical protein